MLIQLPAFNVTFEITENQQATVTANAEETRHIVSALLRSHFNSIEITRANLGAEQQAEVLAQATAQQSLPKSPVVEHGEPKR